MPRTVSSTFQGEKNKASNQPLFLYVVYDYDGDNNNLYFAASSDDVIFDGTTYTAFPVSHEDIGENTMGVIDEVRIKLSNVSRTIQAYLENYDWRGLQVDIIQVWSNQLADTTGKIVDTFYIDSYEANANDVNVVCTGKFDVLDVKLPLESYSRTNCRYKTFKGTLCGYAGAQTECNRTFQRCKELSNQLRFGGQPSTPDQRLYIR